MLGGFIKGTCHIANWTSIYFRCLRSYTRKDCLMPKRVQKAGNKASAKRAKLTASPSSTTNVCQATTEVMEEGANPGAERLPSVLLSAPIKSKSDKKDYRVVRLGNGLTCLLISDTSYGLDKLDEEEKLIEDSASAAAADGEPEDEDGFGEEDDGEEEEDDNANEDDIDEGEDEGSEEDEQDDDGEEDDIDDSEARPQRPGQTTGLKMSAAGLCVRMGSFSDPEDIPGLAHFLEHMVFMGSKKYPDENSFDVFNKQHGGYDNAHTDCETTVFYFETPRRHLLEGLDRFSQFFISPLMKLGSMKREREAVDSEYQMALPSDYNRMYQIFGTLAKAGHPMGKFMWGNQESLSPEGMTDERMHERLHQFFLRHYSAQYMCLAVQSQHALDTMQEWVEQTFSGVQNNKLDNETFGHLDKPFDTDRYHKLYRLIPVKNVYELNIVWSLKPLQDKYKVKPLYYNGWIIGHEGKGSLLAYLRNQVWALSLTAGNQGDGFEFNACFSMFTITVSLTQLGYQQVEKVLSAIFSYLRMMQREGPSERIYNEIQKIEQLDFDLREEKQPSDNVMELCENMQFYPSELFLQGDELMFQYDHQLIKECTDELTFDKASFFLLSKEIDSSELTKTEPWFNTSYAEGSVPDSWVAACQDLSLEKEFHLPEPNIFIAEDVSIRESDREISKYPEKIRNDDQGEVFYKKDDHFLQPRAYIYYHIHSPLPLQSLENSVLLDLLVNCWLQSMIEDTYPAELAQLSYSINPADTGVMIKVSGISDKLPLLLQTILTHFNKLEHWITEKLYKAVLEQTRKNYYNHSIKPKNLVRDVRLSVLQDVFWPGYEKHNIVRNFGLDDLKNFLLEFRKKCYYQALMQGNLTAKEALAVDDETRSTLNLGALGMENFKEHRCNEIPLGSRLIRVKSLNPTDHNTMVVKYFQGMPGNLRDHVKLEVLNMMMEEPLFDILRTKEQLGYHVFNTLRNTFGVLGFSVTVNTQATKFSAEHTDSRISAFLTKFKEDKMNEKDVNQTVSALSKLKVAADVTLGESVSRYWGEILGREYNFDRLEKEVNILASLSLEEIESYFDHLVEDSTKRNLSVHIVGATKDDRHSQLSVVNSDCRIFSLEHVEKSKDNPAIIITDFKEFKDQLKTYPVIHIVD